MRVPLYAVLASPPPPPPPPPGPWSLVHPSGGRVISIGGGGDRLIKDGMVRGRTRFQTDKQTYSNHD